MNPVKGEVPLVLSDGRNLKLVLDMNAMVEAEAAYGKPLTKLMSDAGAGFLGAIAALLQGTLARHHCMTRDDALALMESDMDAITEALEKASSSAFPSAEGNAQAGKPRRGKTSGGNGAKRA